jgi:hypothetical protein
LPYVQHTVGGDCLSLKTPSSHPTFRFATAVFRISSIRSAIASQV